MPDAPAIALVGDYNPAVTAHRAIPLALELARTTVPGAADLAWRWIRTRDIADPARALARCTAVWLVPASPYENTDGALAAVRFARETRRPFLGTCGGFQHALIEYARNLAGLTQADHAETNPSAETLLVTPLACSLVEKTGRLSIAPDSQLARAYGDTAAREGYHCNYGLNPAHRATLERAGLRFTAFDENGEVRAAELPLSVHPFFVGTLFQPERAALRDTLPPLVAALVKAILARRAPSPQRI